MVPNEICTHTAISCGNEGLNNGCVLLQLIHSLLAIYVVLPVFFFACTIMAPNYAFDPQNKPPASLGEAGSTEAGAGESSGHKDRSWRRLPICVGVLRVKQQRSDDEFKTTTTGPVRRKLRKHRHAGQVEVLRDYLGWPYSDGEGATTIKGPDNPTGVFRLLAKSLEGNRSE